MTFGRTRSLTFRIIASTLLASLLVVLALAANPHWHELVHPEAEHSEHGEHTCAVDLFTSGSVDHAAPAPISIAAPTAVESERFVATTYDVASVFLTGSILEHAPPASA